MIHLDQMERTKASAPQQKFGWTYEYTDERLHFEEINEPHLYDINSTDVITILSALIKVGKHLKDDATDFIGTFNNHNMTNYMAALNLYDFSNSSFNKQMANKDNNNEKELTGKDDFIVQIEKAKLVTEYDVNTSVEDMDIVTFGSYPQSDVTGKTKDPIEWIVLDRQDNKALLLSKFIIDCKCYNNEHIKVTWETCTLRKWLNKDFYYQAFNSSEQNKILKTNVVSNDYIIFGTRGVSNTNDKVFCLSMDEATYYFYQVNMRNILINKRIATRGTNYAKNVDNSGSKLMESNNIGWYSGNSAFWLRSPCYYDGTVGGVSGSGYFNSDVLSTGYYLGVDAPHIGVRPAIWILY